MIQPIHVLIAMRDVSFHDCMLLKWGWGVLQLQQAAKRGVMLLNDTQAPEASFDAALLPRTRPEAAFDYWWHVSVTDAKQPQVLTSDLPLWR